MSYTVLAQSSVISQPLQMVIDSITTIDDIELGFNNYGASKAHQWFQQLSDQSSIRQLETLTNYPDPRIRCYAFKAICYRKDPEAYNMFLKHLKDTIHVYIHDYDISYPQMVGDYMLRDLRPDSIQLHNINNLLLNTDGISLYARNDLLKNLNPLPQNYKRIRNIAVKERSEYAILALSRYQKHGDVDIIKTLFDKKDRSEFYGLYCVWQFPDSVFYPYLIKVFEKELISDYLNYPQCRMLFIALAKYPVSQTTQLFEKALLVQNDHLRKGFVQDIYIALIKSPDIYFAPVMTKLNLTPGDMDMAKLELNFEKYTY